MNDKPTAPPEPETAKQVFCRRCGNDITDKTKVQGWCYACAQELHQLSFDMGTTKK